MICLHVIIVHSSKQVGAFGVSLSSSYTNSGKVSFEWLIKAIYYCYTMTKGHKWHSSLVSLPTLPFSYRCSILLPIVLCYAEFAVTTPRMLSFLIQYTKTVRSNTGELYENAMVEGDRKEQCKLGHFVVVWQYDTAQKVLSQWGQANQSNTVLLLLSHALQVSHLISASVMCKHASYAAAPLATATNQAGTSWFRTKISQEWWSMSKVFHRNF